MSPTQKSDSSYLSDNPRSGSTANPGSGTSTTEQIREQAKNVGRDLRDLGGLAKDAAQEQYRYGRDRVVTYTDHVLDQVRQSPMKSVLIAAGVGAIVAMLCRRR